MGHNLEPTTDQRAEDIKMPAIQRENRSGPIAISKNHKEASVAPMF